MNLANLIIRFYCFYKGYKVKKLTEIEELAKVHQNRNEVLKALYGMKPLPFEKGNISPKGLALCLGCYRNKQLIGSLRLLDLSVEKPYAALLCKGIKLQYPPMKTYEIGGLVVLPEFQSSQRTVFLLLSFYAYLYTIKTGRERWIASTLKSLYYTIKRLGYQTELILDGLNFLEEDSTKAKYLKTYLEVTSSEDFCSYYIFLPKGLEKYMVKKYFRKKLRRYFKKMRKVIPYSTLKMKHS